MSWRSRGNDEPGVEQATIWSRSPPVPVTVTSAARPSAPSAVIVDVGRIDADEHEAGQQLRELVVALRACAAGAHEVGVDERAAERGVDAAGTGAGDDQADLIVLEQEVADPADRVRAADRLLERADHAARARAARVSPVHAASASAQQRRTSQRDLGRELRRDRSSGRAPPARRRGRAAAGTACATLARRARAPTVCSITRSVTTQARRIEDAEPVADRDRQRRAGTRIITCACAPYAFCVGPPVVSNVVCCDDHAAAERDRADREVRAERALEIGLVLAKRQIADRARVVAPRRDEPAVVREAREHRGRQRERSRCRCSTRTRRRRSARRPRSRCRGAPLGTSGIEAERHADRAAGRQPGRLVALGRAHAAALDRQIDELARGVGDLRLGIDPRSGSSRRARRSRRRARRRRTRRAARPRACPAGVLTCVRSSTAPSNDSTNAARVAEHVPRAPMRAFWSSKPSSRPTNATFGSSCTAMYCMRR